MSANKRREDTSYREKDMEVLALMGRFVTAHEQLADYQRRQTEFLERVDKKLFKILGELERKVRGA